MKHPEQITRRLLNIDETSEYLGLAQTTIYKMVSQRRLPFVKVGRLVKFDKDLLDEWIKQHTFMPMPERKS